MTRPPLTIDDLRAAARRRLPKALFDTIEGGAGTEQALRRNRSDLAAYSVLPRVLRDVGTVDPSLNLLDRPSPLPLVLGPTGMNGFYWRDGEFAVSAAAATAGLAYVTSVVSSVPLEQLASAAHRLWLQLYPLKDREVNEDLVDRAAAAGCEALVITVDAPRIGLRLRDARNGVQLPPRLNARMLQSIIAHPRWALPFATGYRPTFANLERYSLSSKADFRNISVPEFDASFTWTELARLRKRWAGHFIVKGIMHPDDIEHAARIGASAVVLSNHGGRQLDCAMSTASALARIRSDSFPMEILVDGGVRTGADIFKMLGLGAHAVLIGRAYLYGLAATGRSGVAAAIAILERELRNTMALAGAPALSEIEAVQMIDCRGR